MSVYTSELFEPFKHSEHSEHSKHVKRVEQVESFRLSRLLYELVLKIELEELGRHEGVNTAQGVRWTRWAETNRDEQRGARRA